MNTRWVRLFDGLMLAAASVWAGLISWQGWSLFHAGIFIYWLLPLGLWLMGPARRRIRTWVVLLVSSIGLWWLYLLGGLVLPLMFFFFLINMFFLVIYLMPFGLCAMTFPRSVRSMVGCWLAWEGFFWSLWAVLFITAQQEGGHEPWNLFHHGIFMLS